jgi:hypothetical protein
VPFAPSLLAAPALGFLFGSLPFCSRLSSPALRGKARKLLVRLAIPMRGPAQSLANVVAEEAAQVPASWPAVGLFCVSSLRSPLVLQTPVFARPPSPPASVRLFADGARAHGDNSLFLAGDNEEGGVPIDFSPGASPRFRARGHVSPVCPAAAATAATATAPVGSSRGSCGTPQIPSRTVPVVVDLDDKEPVRASVHCACAAAPVRAVGCVFTFAAHASASVTPVALRHSGRQ